VLVTSSVPSMYTSHSSVIVYPPWLVLHDNRMGIPSTVFPLCLLVDTSRPRIYISSLHLFASCISHSWFEAFKPIPVSAIFSPRTPSTTWFPCFGFFLCYFVFPFLSFFNHHLDTIKFNLFTAPQNGQTTAGWLTTSMRFLNVLEQLPQFIVHLGPLNMFRVQDILYPFAQLGLTVFIFYTQLISLNQSSIDMIVIYFSP